MLIYNVTVKVDVGIAADWLQWMRQEHIPEIMDTGCFTHYQIVQLLEQDDSDGPTYAIQYHSPDQEHYERYIEEFADTLRLKSLHKWGDGVMAFRSLMRIV
jgi:hypothetical protein